MEKIKAGGFVKRTAKRRPKEDNLQGKKVAHMKFGKGVITKVKGDSFCVAFYDLDGAIKEFPKSLLKAGKEMKLWEDALQARNLRNVR